MKNRNSRWKKGNTRYPKIVHGRPECKQRCDGLQANQLVNLGTPELAKYREADGWHRGAFVGR